MTATYSSSDSTSNRVLPHSPRARHGASNFSARVGACVNIHVRVAIVEKDAQRIERDLTVVRVGDRSSGNYAADCSRRAKRVEQVDDDRARTRGGPIVNVRGRDGSHRAYRQNVIDRTGVVGERRSSGGGTCCRRRLGRGYEGSRIDRWSSSGCGTTATYHKRRNCHGHGKAGREFYCSAHVTSGRAQTRS